MKDAYRHFQGPKYARKSHDHSDKDARHLSVFEPKEFDAVYFFYLPVCIFLISKSTS